jgi:hypothetical protein
LEQIHGGSAWVLLSERIRLAVIGVKLRVDLPLIRVVVRQRRVDLS